MERKEIDEQDTTALYQKGLDPNSTTYCRLIQPYISVHVIRFFVKHACLSVHVCVRRRHRLQVNDRVTLRDRRGVDEKRQRGKEKRRGAVRFIGPLQNTDSTEVYIGVELDTPCKCVCVCVCVTSLSI